MHPVKYSFDFTRSESVCAGSLIAKKRKLDADFTIKKEKVEDTTPPINWHSSPSRREPLLRSSAPPTAPINQEETFSCALQTIKDTPAQSKNGQVRSIEKHLSNHFSSSLSSSPRRNFPLNRTSTSNSPCMNTFGSITSRSNTPLTRVPRLTTSCINTRFPSTTSTSNSTPIHFATSASPSGLSSATTEAEKGSTLTISNIISLLDGEDSEYDDGFIPLTSIQSSSTSRSINSTYQLSNFPKTTKTFRVWIDFGEGVQKKEVKVMSDIPNVPGSQIKMQDVEVLLKKTVIEARNIYHKRAREAAAILSQASSSLSSRR